MNFSPFSCPIFLGHLIRERPLLPRRAGALWEGPVPFGRNRESRSREDAGRRNLARVVPRKRSDKKREITALGGNPLGEVRSTLISDGNNSLWGRLVKHGPTKTST